MARLCRQLQACLLQTARVFARVNARLFYSLPFFGKSGHQFVFAKLRAKGGAPPGIRPPGMAGGTADGAHALTSIFLRKSGSRPDGFSGR